MSIIFTSGAAGDPKGVMLSASNFLSNATGLLECRGLVSERDVLLFWGCMRCFAHVALLLFLKILRYPGRIIMTGTHDTMVSSKQYSYAVLKGGSPHVHLSRGEAIGEWTNRPAKSRDFILPGSKRKYFPRFHSRKIRKK